MKLDCSKENIISITENLEKVKSELNDLENSLIVEEMEFLQSKINIKQEMESKFKIKQEMK